MCHVLWDNKKKSVKVVLLNGEVNLTFENEPDYMAFFGAFNTIAIADGKFFVL